MDCRHKAAGRPSGNRDGLSQWSNAMFIETRRLGPVDVDETKLITFAEGLHGFSEHRRFALIQTSPDPVFYWMQSVDDPNLAFVVCDPLTFVPDDQVPIRKDDMQALGLDDLKDRQVLVIVNKVDGDLTANLLGPIVVGTRSLRAKQMVLSERRYSTRHWLMATQAAWQPVAKTA